MRPPVRGSSATRAGRCSVSATISVVDEGDWDVGDLDDGEEAPRDPKHSSDPALLSAKAQLLSDYFAPGTRRVYYQRQLQVLLENDYFHWITAAAIKALVEEGAVGSELVTVGDSVARLLWPLGHRFHVREAAIVTDLIAKMGEPGFATGVGRHGETMFDAALPRIGMRPLARDVRSHRGIEWKGTGHNLDRIFELDGVEYGVEVKNQLQYIGTTEFKAKLAMCEALRLRPFFIMRALPKSYSYEVIKRGGFALVFKYQLYPHGAERFAKEVREVLGLPVDSPPGIYDSTLNRFLSWHRKQLST